MRRAPSRPDHARQWPALRHWLMAGAMLGLLMLLGPNISRVGDKLVGLLAPRLVANPD
ncbi:hypothetical protein [Sphingobium aquiterrae]|uniref:hypothetical protein n=1 Tax=Sphingobium aquiterrae TaxID=2038656 RepID=UPI0030184543